MNKGLKSSKMEQVNKWNGNDFFRFSNEVMIGYLSIRYSVVTYSIIQDNSLAFQPGITVTKLQPIRFACPVYMEFSKSSTNLTEFILYVNFVVLLEK